MIVLVDQDCVVANFDAAINKHLQRMFPGIKLIAPENRTSFYAEHDYGSEYRQAIIDIMHQEGFFLELEPIPGAIEGVNALMDAGHHVMMCTSPLARVHTDKDKQYEARCAREKYEWIDRHLGSHMVDRIILTRDKTLVIGDVLIDDKPDIVGAAVPVWQHLVFGHAYNKGMPNRAEGWGDVLPIIERMQPKPQLAAPILTLAQPNTQSASMPAFSHKDWSRRKNH